MDLLPEKAKSNRRDSEPVIPQYFPNRTDQELLEEMIRPTMLHRLLEEVVRAEHASTEDREVRGQAPPGS